MPDGFGRFIVGVNRRRRTEVDGLYRNGGENQRRIDTDGQSKMRCHDSNASGWQSEWIVPATLKGKKPIGLEFASGISVKTPTWKSVVQTIMQHCNSQPDMHERLMRLSGKVAGRQRIILGKSAEEMNVPLKIDEEIYFEGKFDTEALLTMMIKKVLEPVDG